MILTVDSTQFRGIVLEALRMRTANNMDMKTVIKIIPHAFMEYLHPISCLGFILYTFSKVHNK